jgi:hypothetical protein
MNPIDIRTETIFTLLRLPAARSRPRDWWTLAALAVIGWLGAVAFLGRRLPRRRAWRALLTGYGLVRFVTAIGLTM